MKRGIIESVLIVLSGLTYSFLFWREGMGVNAFIFIAFLLVVLTLIRPGIWQSRQLIVMGTGTVFSALLVVWHHSLLARFTHVSTLILFIGFVQARELRFLWYAFLLALCSLFSRHLGYWRSIKTQVITKLWLHFIACWLKFPKD